MRDDRFLFYMFFYKTSWCPTKKDSHDSKGCIYAHHLRDFRRPPDLFKYNPEDCETLVSGVGWDACPLALKCPKCHTTVERLYHPDKYKRIQCDKQRCNKLEICAFYHSMRERNLALKICKNYRKSQMHLKLPNIKQLNDELLKFYSEEEKIKPSIVTQTPQFIPSKDSNYIDQQRVHSQGQPLITQEDEAYAPNPNPTSYFSMQIRKQSSSLHVPVSEADIRRG